MKTNIFILLLLFFGLSGCSGKSEEPVIPITTDGLVLDIDMETEIGQLAITSGNGDYKIIYPQKMYVGVWGEHLGNSTDDYLRNYSEDIVKITIESGNIVVAEVTFPDKDAHIDGYFMIEDAKKARAVFYLTNPDYSIGIPAVSTEEICKLLLSDSDYWQ